MKNSIRKIGVLAALIASAASNQSAIAATPVESPYATVTEVQVLGSGRFALKLAGTGTVCQGYGFLVYPNFPALGGVVVTQDGAKEMLSIALTAFTTGKTAKVYYYEESPGNCYVDRIWTKAQ